MDNGQIGQIGQNELFWQNIYEIDVSKTWKERCIYNAKK